MLLTQEDKTVNQNKHGLKVTPKTVGQIFALCKRKVDFKRSYQLKKGKSKVLSRGFCLLEDEQEAL